MSVAMEPYLVHHFLERAAEAAPDRPALLHDGRRLTYGELARDANRLARAFAGAGIARGDRIGLLAANSFLYVAAYYAALKCGAIAVPLNTAADPASLRGFLADCGARALVAGPRFGRAALDAAAALPDLAVFFAPGAERLPPPPAHIAFFDLDAALAEEAGAPPDRATIDLDAASIVYTSGSTGRPRGATLSHLNLVANTRSIVSYLGLGPDDRALDVLPFHYVYGKSLLNTHVAAIGSVAIENRFLFPNTALDTLEREECTGFAGVPSTFAILLNRSNFAERRLPSLRYVTQAGGAMSPELTRRLVAALPGRKVFVMYGATEAGARLACLDPADLPRKLGSIGRAIPNVELFVRREDGSEAATDEVGEIVARGSNIMRGYWGDPEETGRALVDGAYRTGDLARRDEDGFLWIVGRKKDMIKSGAHRIAPKEIEDAILEFPEVHEAAVVGVPDELLGEAIKAFVVFREGAPDETLAALEAFLRRRLPAYKVPGACERRAELPKNESGKVLKRLLVE